MSTHLYAAKVGGAGKQKKTSPDARLDEETTRTLHADREAELQDEDADCILNRIESKLSLAPDAPDGPALLSL